MSNKKIVSPTVRLVFGIIFIIVSVIVFFQSLAVATAYSIGNDSTGTTSGGIGVLVAILMLIIGIISIVTRKNNSKGIKITGYVLGIFAALSAFGATSGFSDMGIYGAFLLVGTFFCNWPLSTAKIDPKVTTTKINNNNISTTDEIAKLKSLLDDGAITQEEYDKQKEKLLNL